MGRKIPTTTVMNEWVYNKLNELCRVLHDKYTINWGGCAFVAYCIARNLSERLEIIALELEYLLKINLGSLGV